VTLAFGSTLTHNRALRVLTTSTLHGTVTGTDNRPAANAKVTLFASSSFVPPFQLTDSTDAQGRYGFENIFISFGTIVKYDSLRIEPDVPYLRRTLPGPAVVAGTSTVVDATLSVADVLLVNDDPDGGFADFYTSALSGLNLKDYVWVQKDRGVAKASAMLRFNKNLLIWYTGNATGQTLTPAEQDSIAAYLDRGGRVFLTGQNIAEGLQGSAFLQDRLHLSFVRNIDDPLVHGVQSDPVGRGLGNILTAGFGGANNQNSRDLLQPDNVAKVSIVYDTTAGTVAGVRVENSVNGSKLVFFGFGFEAIRLVPFPIHYQLPKAATVKIEIFNTLGQKVKTLVNHESQSAGFYVAEWDGRNDAGTPVVSGIYFYHLETISGADGFAKTRKMILMR
jgi:hypothetical protein